jgi:hypothetical protein
VCEVGDQYRRAVRFVANRPSEPWFLANHERENPLQSFIVGLGFDSRRRRLWDVRTGRDVWLRPPADAVADWGPMPRSGCLRLVLFGDGGQDLGLGEVDSSKIVGVIRAPARRGHLGRHGAQVAYRGLDSSHRTGARVLDDPGLLGLPGRISHSRSPDDPELVVGRIGDSLQIAPEIFCEPGIFGTDRRQLDGPKSTYHPRGAIDGRAECRNRQGFSGRSPEALARRLPTEDRHRLSVPGSIQCAIQTVNCAAALYWVPWRYG